MKRVAIRSWAILRADIKQGLVAISSPVARALIGKQGRYDRD